MPIRRLPLGPHVAAMQIGTAATEHREHLKAPFEWLGTAVLPADSAHLLAAVGAPLGIRCFQTVPRLHTPPPNTDASVLS